MFGFLGVIGAGLFTYNFCKDASINNDYVNMSKANAEKDERPYYWDTKGRKYDTVTGRRVCVWIDANGDKLLKDYRTGAVLRNLTREENIRNTKESLEDAKKNGYPFYRKWGVKAKGGYELVWTVDGDQPYVAVTPMNYHELGNKIATWYQPAMVDEEMTASVNDGTTYYKYDRSRDKEDTWVKIYKEGYKKFSWREWNKIIQNTMPVYMDSLNNWHNETPDFDDLYKDDLYLAYDRKTDEPYAVKKNRLTRTGISEMWRLYPDGKGGYTREKKWYYYEFIHETRIRKVC